jgi:thiol-disulfide isomerase/thioredoxin
MTRRPFRRWTMSRLAGVAAFLLVPAFAGAQRAIDLPMGSTAPDLTLETLEGKPASLAQYLGKSPLLIEVWATWCESCERLAPRILAAQKKYGDRVRFLGIAVSFNQSPERVRRYIERHAFHLETLYDRKGEVDVVYGVKATSTVIVIDRAGKIVYAGSGGDQDIDAAVRKAL